MPASQTSNVIQAVLFGLDGTLLDSAPDLIASLNHLRAERGLTAMPVDDLRHFVSRGAIGLIKAGMPPCDDETLSKWHDAFLEHYQANSFVESRPFDGVDFLLSELSGKHIPWGIVTNKFEAQSMLILEKTGWLSSASTVICGDSVPRGKPYPDPVFAACNMISIDPSNVLMVGDDLRDVDAGRRAGTHTAFALYGYADRESQSEMSEETALIDSPEAVLSLLDSLVKTDD